MEATFSRPGRDGDCVKGEGRVDQVERDENSEVAVWLDLISTDFSG